MKTVISLLLAFLLVNSFGQTVEIIPQTTVATCDTNNFALIVSNNTGTPINIDTILLNHDDLASFQSSQNNIASGGEVRFIFNSIIEPNTSDTIYYSLFFPCEMIQLTVNQNGSYIPYFIDDSVYVDGNYFQTIPYAVSYPFLTVSSAQLSPLVQATHVGDTLLRNLVYANAGNAAFLGDISFGDSISCNPFEFLAIRIIVNGNVVQTFSNTNQFTVSFASLNISIPPSGTFTIQEELFDQYCILDSCGNGPANSDLIVAWGCDSNLCQSIVQQGSIERDNSSPQITLYRVEPSGTAPHDSTCFNSPDGSPFYNGANLKLHEFKLVNTGNAIAFNVTPNLNTNNGSQSMTSDLLFANNVTFSHPDSTYITYFNTNAQNNSCYEAAVLENYTPIRSITWFVDSLFPGDTMTLMYGTYRCCPSDSNFFNETKYFDTWTIEGTSGNGGSFIANDECGGNIGVVRNQSSPPNLFASNYPRPRAVHLDQTLIEPVSNLTGLDGACNPGATTNFYVWTNNLQLIYGGILINDLDQLFQAPNSPSIEGFISVVIETEQGLNVLPSYFSNIKLSKVGFPDVFPASVNTLQSYGAGGVEIEVIFDIAPFGSLDSLKAYIEESLFHFPLTPCCPVANYPTTYNISWYLSSTAFDCDTCRMAMAKQYGDVNVQCPGCVTHGVIVDNISFNRTNFDFLDTDNDGAADFPLNQGSAPFVSSSRLSMPGDTMHLSLSAHGQDGDSGSGVTFNQWNAYWNPLGDTLEYLYIEVGGSTVFGNFNYTIIADTLTIQSGLLNTSFTIPSASYRTFEDNSRFFYVINLDTLKSQGLVPNNMFYHPNDIYQLEADFTICGNDPGASPELVFDVGGRAFWSGTLLTSYATTPKAGDYLSTPGDASALLPTYGYWCETNATPSTIYRIHSEQSTVWRNKEGVAGGNNTWEYACDKLLSIRVVNKLGSAGVFHNQVNYFPYETRPVPQGFYSLEIERPSGYLLASSELNQLLPSNSGNTVNEYRDSITMVNQGLNYLWYVDSLGEAVNNEMSPLANQNNNDIVGYDSLMLADEFSSQIFNFLFSPDSTCQSAPVLVYDSSAHVFITSPSCSNPLAELFENSVDSLEIVTPAPTLHITHNAASYILEDDSTCYEFTIVNDSISSLVEHPFVYIPDPPFATISGMTYQLNNSNNFVNNNMTNWGGLDVQAFRTTKDIRFCVQTDTCLIDSFPTLEIPIQYGWQCHGYPQSVNDSICFYNWDTLTIQKVPVIFTMDTVQQPNCFALCDTVSLMAQASTLAPGNVSDLWYDLIIPVGTDLIATSASFPNNTAAALPPTPTDTIFLANETVYRFSLGGYPWTLQDTSQTLTVQIDFSYLPGCLIYTTDPPSVLLGGIAYCGDSISTLIITYEEMFVCGDSCIPLDVSAQIHDNYCNGLLEGSIDLSASGAGPFVFDWQGPNGYTASTEDINNLAGGQYDIIIQDAQYCEDTLSLLVDDLIEIDVQAVIQSSSCVNPTSGSIGVTPLGGAPPYTYSWTGPNGFVTNTANINNLESGNYALSLSDSTGCLLDTSFVVPLDSIMAGGAILQDVDTCLGVVTLTAPIGISWQWDNNATTQQITVNQIDTYSVITNNGVCLFNSSIVVSNIPGPSSGPSAIAIGSPNTSTYLSTLINSSMLPPAGVNSIVLDISGKLIIDVSNYSFTNSQLYFAPGASLEISNLHPPSYVFDPNVTTSVQMNGTTLEAQGNCGMMWQGIVLNMNCSLASNDCNINDAMYGVEIAQQGASLNLFNVRFKNNFIGVFSPTAVHTHGHEVLHRQFAINSCYFYTEAPGLLQLYPGQTSHLTHLLEGHTTPAYKHQSYAGIYLIDNVIAAIGTNQTNTFEDLANGIVIQSYHLSGGFSWRVSNNVFFDIQRTSSLSGVSSYPLNTNPVNGFGIYVNTHSSGTNRATLIGNFMDNVNYGVEAQTVHLTANENIVLNTWGGIRHSLSVERFSYINENTITSTGFGIFTLNNAPLSIAEIHNNNISVTGKTRGYGIRVSEVSGLAPANADNIKYNEISMLGGTAAISLENAVKYEVISNIPITLTPNTIGGQTYISNGVNIQGEGGHVIAKNEIKLNGSYLSSLLNPSNRPVGIDVVNSIDNLFECNTAENTFTGIRMAGMADGLILRGNLMNNNFCGLRYTQSMAVNGVLNNLQQINEGNMWTGSFGPINFNATTPDQFNGGAAVNVAFWDLWNTQPTTAQQLLGQQLFFIGSTTPPLMPNASEIYPQGPLPTQPNLPLWFNANAGVDFDCSQSTYFKPSGNPNQILLDKTANGSLIIAEFQEALLKQEQLLLYEQLKLDGSLLGISFKVDSFYYDGMNSTMNLIYEAEKSKFDIYEVAVSEKQQFKSLAAINQMLLDSISFLDSLIVVDSTQATSYELSRSILLASYVANQQQMESLDLLISASQENKRNEAIVKYNSVISTDQIEYNIRQLNSLWLESKGMKTELNGGQLASLLALANQCPLSGGNAVISARSMLQQLYTDSIILYDDYSLCTEEGFSINKWENVSELKNSFIVFPNPSENEVNIVSTKEFFNEVKLIDILGKVLLQKQIQATQEYKIDLNSIPRGIYHLSLKNGETSIYQTVLIKK